MLASPDQFFDIEIKVGTIVKANTFVAAKKPAYQLLIDFGDIGLKKSSAQITDLYTPESLVGKQVLAVVNFPPKQIANFLSEVLVLGLTNASGEVILISPDREVENGLLLS